MGQIWIRSVCGGWRGSERGEKSFYHLPRPEDQCPGDDVKTFSFKWKIVKIFKLKHSRCIIIIFNYFDIFVNDLTFSVK